MAVLLDPPRRRPTELDDHRWLHDHYIGRGLSIEQLADQLDCGMTTVWRALDRMSIPKRPRHHPPRALNRLDRELLVRLYVVEQRSALEIAAIVGVGPTVVYTALRTHGIKVRPRRGSDRTGRLLSHAQATRQARERAERQQRHREAEEQWRQDATLVLDALGPDATPAKRLTLLLMVDRKRGHTFQTAWPRCLDAALAGARFEAAWRRVLESRQVKAEFRRAYVRVGPRLPIQEALTLLAREGQRTGPEQLA